jgi:histidinol-phosphate phosphatase family protein
VGKPSLRPVGRWISVRLQAGNADDAPMLLRHGRRWREHAGVPRGRRRPHLLVTAAGATAVLAAGTGEFAWSRVRPGPRTPGELVSMGLTSAAIPAVATWHWLAGFPRALVRGRRRDAAARAAAPAAAVLFDRDGTLVADRPYNGDPDAVVAMPSAPEALERLRTAGVRTAVISNQSGMARGLLDGRQVAAVNRRVEQLLGALGPWVVCPHGPGDGCACRKPAPGLVLRAAGLLGVEPSQCVVVGDIGGDMQAARAAGARAVLVPTPETLGDEVAAAPCVAPDLATAVDLILRGEV